jgi:hypothetical protein
VRGAIVASLIALAGCRPGAAAEPAGGDGAAAGGRAPAGWLETVRSKARGGPALLAWLDSSRLVASTPEGTTIAEIAAVKADEVKLDWRSDLLWIRSADRLLVVDLRAPSPAPQPIVTQLSGPLPFAVAVTSSKSGQYTTVSRACADEKVTLKWDARPSVSVAGAKVVGAKWLAQSSNRPLAQGPEAAGFDASSNFDEMKIPSRKGCDSAEVCGRTEPFGGTGWKLVLVGSKLDRCPGKACLLFDPKSGEYATPRPPLVWAAFKKSKPGSCGPYLFDKSKQWFLTDTSACKSDGTCVVVKGQPLGWADLGAAVGDAD